MTNLTFKKILEPINGKKISGINLREESSLCSIYYELKDKRQKARMAESKFLQKESEDDGLKTWKEVSLEAELILSSRSKDLEIMAWWIEALLRTDGFSGLTRGFKMAQSLINLFWDDLYPEPDEDGLDFKIAAFKGLNGEDLPGSLINPIKSVSLTKSNSNREFALWQYQQALEIDRIVDPQKREQRICELGFSKDDIYLAVNETSPQFYEALINELNESQLAFESLVSIFHEKCGDHAPPSSYINNALNDVKEHIVFLLQESAYKDKFYLSEVFNPGNIEENSTELYQTGENEITEQLVTSQIPIKSRSEALKNLTIIADYFLTSEPHSPLPYLLNRAIRWANMALPDLLQELIEERDVKAHIEKLTGINLMN